jgi:hypothetical protein
MEEQAEMEFAEEATSARGNTAGIKDLPEAFRANMWQPGQSGNRNGRPKRKPITEELERLLDEIDPTDKKHRRTYRKRLAVALAEMVIKKGNVAAFTEIADRVEGKVAQRQEHTGAEGGPMLFESLSSRAEVEQKIAIILMQAQERKAEAQPAKTIEGEVGPAATTSQPVIISQPVTTSHAVTASQSVKTSQGSAPSKPAGKIDLDW